MAELEQASAPGSKTPVAANDAWAPPRQRDTFILRQLVEKDFKLKYRRSALGVAWSVLNPLLMMVVMAVVFTRVMRGADSSIPNFPLYLIIGNTAFSMMTDSTTQGMNSIIAAAPLLKKVKINRYVFPIQKVLFSIVSYAFQLIAVALVMIAYRWTPSLNLLLLPLFVIYLGVFCAGLSLLLSAAAVFFRDVLHLWSVIITAWTYATPIFYSINILPGWMQALERLNPMYLYLSYVRDIMLFRVTPSLELNLACGACALVSLAIGWAVFRHNEHKFILYI